MRHIWHAPGFDNEELAQRARMFHSVGWAVVVVVTVIAPLWAGLNRESWWPVVAVTAAMDALVLWLLWLNKRGRTRDTSIALVCILIALAAILAPISSGITAAAVGAPIIIVITTGLLLGERAGLVAGGTCIAIGFALVAAERLGVFSMPPTVNPSAMSVWIISLFYLGTVIGLQRLAGRTVRTALDRAGAEIAERTETERRLRTVTQRLRLALDAGSIGVWDRDLHTNRVVLDERLFAMYGLTPTADRSLSQEECVARIHPEDLASQQAALERLAERGGSVVGEFRVVRPDGVLRYVQGAAAVVRDEQGRPSRIVGMTIDITSRKQAEDDRERLVHDLGERVKEMRLLHAVARLLQTGPPCNQALLTELVMLMPSAWQYSECCEARIEFQGMEAITPGWRESPWKQSATFETSGGTGIIEVVYLEERPPLDEGPFLQEERELLDALTDMLEAYIERRYAEENRRRVEMQLRQSQKLQALGTLSGGIAHDFNNILTAISGNAELALLSATPEDPLRPHLEEIFKAGSRASDLVRRILVFSRQQETQRAVISLQPVIEEALKLLRATLPSTIQIRSSYAADIPTVSADATQIHQIMMNLGTNAGHAMSERGGVLSVSLDRVWVGAEFAARAEDLTEGPCVRLTVADTGCGMTPEVAERIFEPFFTTKGPDEGTGLGLSVVHGIVKSHDGAIAVSTEAGQGTSFTIYFPAAAAVPASPSGTVSAVS